MAFFKKLKKQNKHKKLSEESTLAISVKDLCNESENNNEQNLSTFDLKYLGSTAIDSERSQNATALAIKSVISSTKRIRKKNQRVKLNISSEGIEVVDTTTEDSMIKVSIYKISYCSADAAHDHVFAFVGSESNSNDEDLKCYVFLCPKRKIAHDVTLTVARCFENAYQNWRDTVEKKMCQEEIRNSFDSKKTEKDISDDTIRDLLIDFTPEIQTGIYSTDTRNYLQNTWVSFEDDTKQERLFGVSWEQQQLVF